MINYLNISLKKGLKIYIAAIAFGALSIASAASKPVIEGYTIMDKPFTNVPKGVITCIIDEANEEHFNRLKQSLHTKMQTAKREDTQNTGKSVADFISDNQAAIYEVMGRKTCQVKASFLKLKKLPAIVINDKYIIYGETDIARALERLVNKSLNKPMAAS